MRGQMAHKNRVSHHPTPEVYSPPPALQRQVASPQVYMPQNFPNQRFLCPSATSYGCQTYEGDGFWSRSTSYYKCPPFIRSRDSRNIPGASRVSGKNGHLESVDSVDHYCEVCKVNCVGKQSYSAHLAGQKHKKKLKQQEQQHKTGGMVCGVEDSTPHSYDTCQVTRHNSMVFDDHLAGHKHQLKAQPIISNEETKFSCKSCGIACIGKVSYNAHLLGSKHRENVESVSCTMRLGCAVCGVACNSRVSYEGHIASQKHKRNVRQQYAGKSSFCKVCQIDCKTRAAYNSHIVGKKHCRKRALLENQKQSSREKRGEDSDSQILEEVEGKKKELQCPLCNIKCSGTDTYRAHLSGKQHQRAIKLQTARGSAVPDCETVLVGADRNSWVSSPHADLDCIEEVLVGKATHFRCRLCECTFSDLKARNVHENGKKHQTALRRFKAAASLPPSSASRSTPSGQIDEELSGSCGATASTQRSLSPRSTLPTPLVPSAPSSSTSSASFLCGRPRIPPMGSGFVRPLGPCAPHHGLQPLVSLPPHVLADERYMQTKLRRIAPSEEENSLMTLAIDSVSDALRRILRARGDDADINSSLNSAECMHTFEPTGVFIVGPAAVGLLLGGQRTADVVLVSHELPSEDCVAEVAEELEELLKESCKNHTVTVTTVEGASVLVQMTPKSTSSTDNSTAADIIATVRLRLTSTRILDMKAGTVLRHPKSGANDHYHEDRTTAAAAAFATSGSGNGSGGTHDDDDEQTQFSKAHLCLSPRVCRDALTDMRRALWLQSAMAAHPAKAVVQNVARLMRCLIRDSQPLSWGHFPDYVLMVLLERLSYMDLAPPNAYKGAPPRLRMGLLFRRLLECLSTGALISRDGELANLPDPVGTNGALLLDDMKQTDRLAATSSAQMALRLVAFRQIYKLLDIPKFVPPSPSQYLPKNGVATKRRATGDCGFGGSHVHDRNHTSASVVCVATTTAKVMKCHQQDREEASNVNV